RLRGHQDLARSTDRRGHVANHDGTAVDVLKDLPHAVAHRISADDTATPEGAATRARRLPPRAIGRIMEGGAPSQSRRRAMKAGRHGGGSIVFWLGAAASLLGIGFGTPLLMAIGVLMACAGYAAEDYFGRAEGITGMAVYAFPIGVWWGLADLLAV